MPEDALTSLDTLRLAHGAQRVEFVSDLHLAPEWPRTREAFFGWLRHSTADHLVILGDLFEAWIGDDALATGFEAECAAALREASRRRPVAVMRGNRDFLLGDAFFQHTGCQELDDPCRVSAFGLTLLLSHGDALCLDDQDYQRFRAQVRGEAWQQAFLSQPLVARQQIAAQMREASRQRQQGRPAESYADPDPALATRWLAQAGAQVLLHGHTHRPTDESRPEGWRRLVLSDWDLDHAERAEVLVWTASGFERQALR